MHFGQLNTSAEGNGDSVYLRQPLSVLGTLLAASDGEVFCLQQFHHAALAVNQAENYRHGLFFLFRNKRRGV